MAFAIASHIYVMRTVMPDVVESLDTTIGYVQIILVYLTVVAAVFVPTSRTLAQILGARRLFVLGLLAFVAGILITATSSGVVTLMLSYSVISGLAISALVQLRMPVFSAPLRQLCGQDTRQAYARAQALNGAWLGRRRRRKVR